MSTNGSGVSITGELKSAVDVNQYTVFLRAGEHYELYAGGQDTGDSSFISDPKISISGFGQSASDDDGGAGVDAALHFTPTVSGAYTVTVENLASDSGKYSLVVTNQSFEADLNANPGSSLGVLRLAEDDVLVSQIEFPQDADLVSVQLFGGNTYTIQARGGATGDGSLSDPFLELFDQSGHVITVDDDSGAGANSQITFTAPGTGLFFVRVSGFGDNIGSYELEVIHAPTNVDVVPDSPANTDFMIMPGATIQGSIDSAGDEDAYRIEVTKGVLYEFNMVSAGNGGSGLPDPRLELLDASGNIVTFNDDGSGLNAKLFFIAPDSGVYFIRAGSSGDAAVKTGNYNLSVNVLSTGPSPLQAIASNQDATYSETITGSGDSDVLSGGAGSDFIDGGLGIDVVDYSASASAVAVNLSTGIAIGAATGLDHLSNLEFVRTGSGNDAITGDDQSNNLDGGAGNDTLRGGLGNDFLAGGSGQDTASYSQATSAVAVNLATGTASGGEGNDGLQSIENVEGSSAGDDTLVGSIGANKLFGLNGNDTLSGGDGNDSLDGGLGDDSLEGGAANDTLVGGAGRDALLGGSGNDLLDGGPGGNLPGPADGDDLNGEEGNDTLIGGAENDTLGGGGGNDSLEGGDGDDAVGGEDGNNTVNGGDGNDLLSAGSGLNLLNGGAGDDFFNFVLAGTTVSGGAGIDTVNAAVSLTLAGDVENLTIAEVGNINGTGNALANVMTGNSDNNTLSGLGGTDTLVGGGGNDTLIGGAGKDALTGGGGLDVMKYNALSDSGTTFAARDAINTFAHGDKIDLSAIDAKTNIGGNQAFTFVTNFTGQAGQVQFDVVAANSFLITADVNGDSVADFSLNLFTSPGFGTLQAFDFIL
jgi:Ca2+-binding RTX toxin-like protein